MFRPKSHGGQLFIDPRFKFSATQRKCPLFLPVNSTCVPVLGQVWLWLCHVVSMFLLVTYACVLYIYIYYTWACVYTNIYIHTHTCVYIHTPVCIYIYTCMCVYIYTCISCSSILHGCGLNPTFSGTGTASRPLLFQWRHIEGIVAGALRPSKHGTMGNQSAMVGNMWKYIWGWVKTLVPSEPQNSWQMDVHPTKNGTYRYWPIAIYI